MSHKPKNDKFKPKEPERVRPRLKETTSQKKLTSNTLHFKRKSPEHSPNQDYFNSYPERVPNQDKSSSQRSAKRVRTETVEYQRLHDKLSSIETRINEMKANIQKKRESKQKKDEDRSRRKLQLRQKSLRALEMERKSNNDQSPKSQKQNLNQFITQAPEKKKRIPFKVEKLGGLVTTQPERQAHPFDKNPYSPRSNIYYVSQAIKGFRDSDSLVYDHLKTSVELLHVFNNIRMPNNEEIKKRAVNLARKPECEGKNPPYDRNEDNNL